MQADPPLVAGLTAEHIPARMHLSDNVRGIEGSATLAIAALCRELRAQGREVIDLGVGEPDFRTPEFVSAAGIAAIEQGFTHYTPVPGVQAEVRAPVGEVGELWVRGPNVMLGYWNRPDATAAALVDGWYRTGDLAREDEDGYFFMVDRAKDMIITGGENVYSVEVEAALSRHPGVDEVAVFGVPDERWGEAVHAVVVGDVQEADLVAHCRASLAGFKVPRSFEVRAEPLPKSGAGKLLKHRLRAPYWEGHDRLVG